MNNTEKRLSQKQSKEISNKLITLDILLNKSLSPMKAWKRYQVKALILQQAEQRLIDTLPNN